MFRDTHQAILVSHLLMSECSKCKSIYLITCAYVSNLQSLTQTECAGQQEWIDGHGCVGVRRVGVGAVGRHTLSLVAMVPMVHQCFCCFHTVRRYISASYQARWRFCEFQEKQMGSADVWNTHTLPSEVYNCTSPYKAQEQ